MTTEDPAYIQYRIAVPTAFEAVFSHFYFAENNSAAAITRTLLPSFQTIMVFRFAGGITLQSKEETVIEVGKCMVAGPIKQAFSYTLAPGARMLVVNFKDDAFFRFFGISALADARPADPDQLVAENCFTALWQELEALDTTAKQVETLLDWCRPYLKEQDIRSAQLAQFTGEGQSPIKTLSATLQQSERTLQNHHKKHFGYSAKEKGRYQRFLNAINYLQQHPGTTDWFALIDAFGYYDQSQLIHDFKHYLNLSPGRYLKFQQDICRAGS